MFTELSSDSQRIWMILLLVMWAALLFGGMAFGRLNSAGTHRTPTWGRMFSSFTLVVAGWSWYVFSRGTPSEFYALLVAVGMMLGWVGDLFMARLIPMKEHVLGGIGSFGLGHIAYIVAFVRFGDQFGLNAANIRWGALIGWLLVGFVGWYVVVFRGQKATPLHYAALPYALLLSSTAGLALGLALQANGFIGLALGAALFLLSDLLLAAQLFNGLHFRLIGDVVWGLYGPAQMLIVYSIGAAMAFAS